MRRVTEQQDSVWPPPPVTSAQPGVGRPHQVGLTRWRWLDRLLGVSAALLFQGGLSAVAVLVVMLLHLHYDINEDTPIPLTLWYPAMGVPLLLSLAVYATSRHRFQAFSGGFLCGILVVSVAVLAQR